MMWHTYLTPDVTCVAQLSGFLHKLCAECEAVLLSGSPDVTTDAVAVGLIRGTMRALGWHWNPSSEPRANGKSNTNHALNQRGRRTEF